MAEASKFLKLLIIAKVIRLQLVLEFCRCSLMVVNKRRIYSQDQTIEWLLLMACNPLALPKFQKEQFKLTILRYKAPIEVKRIKGLLLQRCSNLKHKGCIRLHKISSDTFLIALKIRAIWSIKTLFTKSLMSILTSHFNNTERLLIDFSTKSIKTMKSEKATGSFRTKLFSNRLLPHIKTSLSLSCKRNGKILQSDLNIAEKF